MYGCSCWGCYCMVWEYVAISFPWRDGSLCERKGTYSWNDNNFLWLYYLEFGVLEIMEDLFSKRFLIMLFKFCRNMYGWKNMWKYILWCLNNNFHYFNTVITKQAWVIHMGTLNWAYLKDQIPCIIIFFNS